MSVKRNEAETRRDRIDPKLREAGWNIDDPNQVLFEVDTINSDFKAGIYKTQKDTLETEKEKAYADYVLFDKNKNPIAVVEAKKTYVSTELGKKQAQEYAKDIKKQTGENVFLYYTNGEEIKYWNYPFESPRSLLGFHSQDDLERLDYLNKEKQKTNGKFSEIDPNIIDRSYQEECVKKILEDYTSGKRKFLIVQATGTGKTRVAMALIDVLLKSHVVRKILFLTDRLELRRQAYDENFKKFFPEEAMEIIKSDQFTKNSRIYVSTLQTLKKLYKNFSVGFFDIIISDEAHRSIFHKFRDPFRYFDALQVGLTATPSEMLTRNTFEFFQCEGDKATFEYTFDDALDDDVLCDYSLYDVKTEHQILGIHKEDLSVEERVRLTEEGIDLDEFDYTGTELEKKVIASGTRKAWVKEIMENCIKDDAGKPAKTIIFPLSIKAGKKLVETFDELYPRFKGTLVNLISSEDRRSKLLIKNLKMDDEPRIAISVGILDTGVDIPEVCNLVFARPVRTKIRFWQMIGRGTRHDDVCKHREWLPNGKKEGFLIFDFMGNFDWFNMHPKGMILKPTVSISTRILGVRVEQCEKLLKLNDITKLNQIKSTVLEDIKKVQTNLNEKQLDDVKILEDPNFWSNVSIDHLKFLKTKITPMMKYLTSINLKESSLTMKCEQLVLEILELMLVNEKPSSTNPKLNKMIRNIAESIARLPNNLEKIKPENDFINSVIHQNYWNEISIDKIYEIRDRLASLMKHQRERFNPILEIQLDDPMVYDQTITYGSSLEENIQTYKTKFEDIIKEMVKTNSIIKKIQNLEFIDDEEIIELKNALESTELCITIPILGKIYNRIDIDLIKIIQKILGIDVSKENKKIIDDAFREFVRNNDFSSEQISFVRSLQILFEMKKHIEMENFYGHPFDKYSNSPIPLFTQDKVDEMIDLCDELENEVCL